MYPPHDRLTIGYRLSAATGRRPETAAARHHQSPATSRLGPARSNKKGSPGNHRLLPPRAGPGGLIRFWALTSFRKHPLLLPRLLPHPQTGGSATAVISLFV